jgi:hypothetical protein
MPGVVGWARAQNLAKALRPGRLITEESSVSTDHE